MIMAALSSTSFPSSTDERNADEYAYLYQKLKFRETVDDEIDLAHVKRLKLLLNIYQCKQYYDRCATSWLLREHLEEYQQIVDDKDGLNNYAEYVDHLCRKSSKPPTAYKTWTSERETCDDSIKSLIQELSLDMRTAEEEEADATIVQNLRSSVLKHCNSAVKPFYKPPTTNADQNLAKSNGPSTFQIKKPYSLPSSSGLFNPTTSFRTSATIPLEKNKKRSINEVDGSFSKPAETQYNGFRTAKTELSIQNMHKYGNSNNVPADIGVKRSLGARSRSVCGRFVPPIKSETSNNQWNDDSQGTKFSETEDERLRGLDQKMIELICNEIMDHGSPITWDDISGLEFAKRTIQEIVVWPLLRPDIFTGLRRPPKGILLFGPPGTGKTLIGKCIASQSSSTFFSISASSLTSKWIGESEKLVRTLFAVARCHQPAVIFIDEIDSLLSQRSESEHESSRRIKTEFLVQLDGATTNEDDRILVIGATNRPQELDEAARRRLVKRLYIPLPEFSARRQIIQRLMSTEKCELSEDDTDEIARLTDGYSGADVKNLCQEASLEPIRSIDFRLIGSIDTKEVRAVTCSDFKSALKVVRSSVSSMDLNQYLEWDKIYGSTGT